MSLYNCLCISSSLDPYIFYVLLRFRLKHTALVRDIENGFHNIEVPPKDRDSLRFLWFNDIKAKELQVIVHWFNRVVVWLQFFTIPFDLHAEASYSEI